MTGHGSQAKQHDRTRRTCQTFGCVNKPEPKDRYCLACELMGNAPLDGRRKPTNAAALEVGDH
jgi:hypothetical protein